MAAARQGPCGGVIGPVGEQFHVAAPLHRGPGDRPGGAMQNLLVEDEAAGKAVLRLVKQRDGGRVTCLPSPPSVPVQSRGGGAGTGARLPGGGRRPGGLRSPPPPRAQALLGRTVVVDHLDHGVALARARRYRFPVVTLEGEILRPGASMTGGSVQRTGGCSPAGGRRPTWPAVWPKPSRPWPRGGGSSGPPDSRCARPARPWRPSRPPAHPRTPL